MNGIVEIPKQELLITEEKIISPLVTVLEGVTPKGLHENRNVNTSSQSLNQSLDELFPEQKHEDKEIQEAKQILGEAASKFKKEGLKIVITEMKFLVSTWLDDFERELFEGKTLNEMLHEKGGL